MFNKLNLSSKETQANIIFQLFFTQKERTK